MPSSIRVAVIQLSNVSLRHVLNAWDHASPDAVPEFKVLTVRDQRRPMLGSTTHSMDIAESRIVQFTSTNPQATAEVSLELFRKDSGFLAGTFREYDRIWILVGWPEEPSEAESDILTNCLTELLGSGVDANPLRLALLLVDEQGHFVGSSDVVTRKDCFPALSEPWHHTDVGQLAGWYLNRGRSEIQRLYPRPFELLERCLPNRWRSFPTTLANPVTDPTTGSAPTASSGWQLPMCGLLRESLGSALEAWPQTTPATTAAAAPTASKDQTGDSSRASDRDHDSGATSPADPRGALAPDALEESSPPSTPEHVEIPKEPSQGMKPPEAISAPSAIRVDVPSFQQETGRVDASPVSRIQPILSGSDGGSISFMPLRLMFGHTGREQDFVSISESVNSALPRELRRLVNSSIGGDSHSIDWVQWIPLRDGQTVVAKGLKVRDGGQSDGRLSSGYLAWVLPVGIGRCIRRPELFHHQVDEDAEEFRAQPPGEFLPDFQVSLANPELSDSVIRPAIGRLRQEDPHFLAMLLQALVDRAPRIFWVCRKTDRERRQFLDDLFTVLPRFLLQEVGYSTEAVGTPAPEVRLLVVPEMRRSVPIASSALRIDTTATGRPAVGSERVADLKTRLSVLLSSDSFATVLLLLESARHDAGSSTEPTTWVDWLRTVEELIQLLQPERTSIESLKRAYFQSSVTTREILNSQEVIHRRALLRIWSCAKSISDYLQWMQRAPLSVLPALSSEEQDLIIRLLEACHIENDCTEFIQGFKRRFPSQEAFLVRLSEAFRLRQIRQLSTLAEWNRWLDNTPNAHTQNLSERDLDRLLGAYRQEPSRELAEQARRLISRKVGNRWIDQIVGHYDQGIRMIYSARQLDQVLHLLSTLDHQQLASPDHSIAKALEELFVAEKDQQIWDLGYRILQRAPQNQPFLQRIASRRRQPPPPYMGYR